MDSDNPAVVVQVTFTVHARNRETAVALADEVAKTLLTQVGGEPWEMQDDDFKRVQPPQNLTLTDDQGYMYIGMRRYIFRGPHVGSVDMQTHDGFRVQRGIGEA